CISSTERARTKGTGSQLTPRLREKCARLIEKLWQHAGVADDRHEVHITAPARDHVLVQVRGDAGASDGAEIHADVEALRGGRLSDGRQCMLRELHEFGSFGTIEISHVRDMAERHD